MSAPGVGSRGLLVLNLGSATLKAAFFDDADAIPAASADDAHPNTAPLKGSAPSSLPFAERRGGSARGASAAGASAFPPPPTHRITLPLDEVPGHDPQALLDRLSRELGLLEAPRRIAHRVVHGGDATEARLLDPRELERLHKLAPLAPLHQPPVLALIEAGRERWPEAVQHGVFDTAFHADLPPVARRLPVPRDWGARGLRRYGFHGLAFASAMRQLRQASPAHAAGRVVLAHLGGGSSLCAVRDGHSIDTTMSVTPLDGVPMLSRCGSLDPGAVLFLLRHAGYDYDTLEHALYRDCGLRGIAGAGGDMRTLLASGSADAGLALQVFALRVAQGIAAMITALGGIDALVFTGGIGANAPEVRTAIVRHLAWLDGRLDAEANARGDRRIDAGDGRFAIWRLDVDEESEIAMACRDVGVSRS